MCEQLAGGKIKSLRSTQGCDNQNKGRLTENLEQKTEDFFFFNYAYYNPGAKEKYQSTGYA